MTQVLPDLTHGAVHVKPHCFPSHVSVPCAGGAGQGEHEVPQLLVLVLLKHSVLQKWKPELQNAWHTGRPLGKVQFSPPFPTGTQH
jgi:hypothetical protein